MTDQAPPPLTQTEADLRDFPFMPLEIFRLRRSKAWLACKRRPELAFYMLNLWTASWHERPAGSLEDDDDVLADLAMCSPEKWSKVRDAVLRGWTKCSDGRLYHPVVAEKVVEAWSAKVAQRQRTLRGRIVALEKRIAECPDPNKKLLMNQDLLVLSQELLQSQSQSMSPPINRSGRKLPQSPSTATTEAKGQGQGQGEREGQGYIYNRAQDTGVVTGTAGENPADPPTDLRVELTAHEHHQRFEQIKAAYPKFSGRQDWINAEANCRAHIDNGRATWEGLLDVAERYAKHIRGKKSEGTQYVKTPGRFFEGVDADAYWRQEWPIPVEGNGKAQPGGTHAEMLAALDARVDPNDTAEDWP